MYKDLVLITSSFPWDLFLLILTPLLLIWWYLPRRINDLTREIIVLQEKIELLQPSTCTCNCSFENEVIVSGIEDLSGKVNNILEEITVLKEKNDFKCLAPVFPPKPIEEQKEKLELIEGIGPKIQELLYANGIFSFKQLSMTDLKVLDGILDKGGRNFQMHKASVNSWAKQAKYLVEGKFIEFLELQKVLIGGKDKKKGKEEEEVSDNF